jgi:LuxR family maltose regulon positive regulatory protein
METQLHLAQGDLPAALAWSLDPAWEKKLLHDSHTFIYAYEFGKITQAQVLLAQGRATAAQNLLREVITQLDQQSQTSQTIKLPWLQMKAAALQALAYQALGDLASALSRLERAMSLAKPEGYIRLFIDEGEPMAQLLSQAARADLMPDYTGQLLAAFPNFRIEDKPSQNPKPVLRSLPFPGASPPIVGSQVEGSKIQNLVEPLSPRELELLRLIATGQSNQEIAQELFLAIGTVKKHLNNIFGKLEVSNRTQAVARARELNLL